MRGAFAMPDAECPRCGATQPPPEAKLATCAACGLVFTPHEILHKPPPAKPKQLPKPPPGIVATRDANYTLVAWPLPRWLAAFSAAFAFLFAWPTRELFAWWWPLAIPSALVVVAWLYLALVALVSSHVVRIDATTLGYRQVPLPRRRAQLEPLSGITMVRFRRISRPESMIGDLYKLELLRGDRRKLVLSSRERAPLEYLTKLLHHLRDLPIARLDEE
jgi:hypothetical protein